MEPCIQRVFSRTPPWCTTIINLNSPPVRKIFEIGLSSGIKDGTFKTDFDYYPLPNHKLKFGGLLTYHKFIPNVASGRQDYVIFAHNN
jgi:hypothetical protein